MKIALIGYGKMGHMIEQIALERGHEIVCKIDVNNQDDFDSPAFASADVAIEFTNPTSQRQGGERLHRLDERSQSRCGSSLQGRQANPLLGQ